jgi:hypothetical protein
MMFYNPHSYEQMKEQLEERRIEHERLRRADAFDQRGHGALRNLVGRVGGLLIRLGTWLEQPSHRLERIGS